MARVQLFICFTILFASVTLLDVVSAHLKFKPSLPQIEAPKTVKDVEPYTVKVVMVFVSDLEKECPKTSKFKVFFEKLRAYAKYVCPIKRKDQVDYERDLKAKAGGIVQAISSFAIGKIKDEIQEEKMEVINTFKYMRFVAAKILGSGKKEESEESMTLSAEQQKEIQEGILRWETIMTRVANTMAMITTSSSSSETSTTEKGGSSDKSKSSGKEISGPSSKGKGSSEDTKGSSSSPSGSSGKETSSKDTKTNEESSSVASGKGTSSKDTKTNEESSSAASGKETSSKGAKTSEESSSASSGKETSSKGAKTTGEASQSSGVNVEQVEAETSKQVSTFIMNLEKKCPQKEEYKAFFEQLKGTMMAPAKERKGLFTRIKSAAGKVSGAMAFMRARIGTKSAEVKKSMETYQAEVMKTLQELETIHSQIVSQNKGKTEGSLKCTPAQQTQIKQTITKWEQVTTQFVQTAVQSETKSSSTSTSSVGKMMPN